MKTLTLNVVIAEDQTLLRELMVDALTRNARFASVTAFDNGRDALDHCLSNETDVVLLDVYMPELNGIEVFRQLKSSGATPRVLFLSSQSDPANLKEAIGLGAQGFVSKNLSLDAILTAVDQVAGGGSFFSSAAVGTLSEAAAGADDASPLSPREREILQLVAEGNTTKEIAQKLSVSGRTVEKHRENLMRKLGIRDIAGLTRYAVRTGLVSIE